VFRLRIVTVKNSMKRSAARSPAPAMSAGRTKALEASFVIDENGDGVATTKGVEERHPFQDRLLRRQARQRGAPKAVFCRQF
jgi:hypothetical protein